MPDLISVSKTSPATTFILGGDLLSQSYAGNYSTVRFYLKAVNGPGGSIGSFFNDWGQQQGHVEGIVHFGTHSGQPFLPSGYSNGAQRWLDVFDVNISHDANGYAGAVTVRMYLGYGGVNESHYATFNNFPRIPKAPRNPSITAIDAVTNTSFGVRYNRGDDMGAGIDYDHAQWATDSNFANVVWDDAPFGSPAGSPNGYSNPAGAGFSLAPGRTYYVRVRSHNSQGYSGWSGTVSQYVGLPAPTLNSWTQDSTGKLVATWSPPSTTTGLTGYRLQVATNAGFTENVTSYNLGNIQTVSVGGLAGGRRYWARVAALTSGGANTYSASRDAMLVLASGDLDGWTRAGTKPTNVEYYTAEGIRRGTVGSEQALFVESVSTGTVTLNPGVLGIQRTVTGLTVGKAYRFEARATATATSRISSYGLKVINEETAAAVTVNTSGVSLGYIEFVADATSAVLQILHYTSVSNVPSGVVVESAAFTRIKLYELNTDFPQRLRSTVYESNLANHFDLACNSVGATWYVAKDGVTRFRLPATYLPVSAIFSDQIEQAGVSYVDIVAGYDTRTTVNRIEATNYGVDAEGINEENDQLVVQDLASQGTYGVYRSTLALNLHDVAPYDDSFQNRLTTLLAEYGTPEPQVSQLRWNAQEDLALANALEVGQRILVRYRGREYDSQIVAISHDITPSRWMLTLDLNPITGATS